MILLYKGKSAISKAIRWQTNSIYSHAAWMLRDGSIIEAWHKGGVRHCKGPFDDHRDGTAIDFFEVRRIFDRDRLEGFLLAQVGKKYDFPGIMGFLKRSNCQAQSKWFCSELVFAALKKQGVDLLKRIPAYKVSPGMLAYSPLLEQIKAAA